VVQPKIAEKVVVIVVVINEVIDFTGNSEAVRKILGCSTKPIPPFRERGIKGDLFFRVEL
jgi:hypothetical protein